ncbi:MAG: glycosyltransferase family 39 protein [Gammaproteobacteria bacterium]|nr:glycosyltransferase family 39 protein [Gammaproteobacteria bacterium]
MDTKGMLRGGESLAQRIYTLLYKHRNLFLILAGIVLYIAFLGLREVWYPDEPDIAEVARAMFESGDWVSPRRMGVIWIDYPPMIYWIGTISSHLFGEMSAFALRFPNAIAALVTILMTAAVANAWYGRAAAFWTGFSMLTFLQFIYEGNSYRPDIMFALTIAAGIFSYAVGSEAGKGLAMRALAFAFFGVAMLSKGPLGLLLPGLVLVIWLGLDRRWLRILELAPLSLIAIAVYGLWFAANAEAMGWSTALYEFYAQNFERFSTSEHRGHGQPWFYYLRNFWVDFLPWSWLFPAAIWWLYRSGKWDDRRMRLMALWFFVFFAFLSLAATKRQLYLLPAYPALAVMLATWLAEVCRPASDSRTGTLAMRLYAWIATAAMVVLGGIVLWLSQNLDVLAAGRELNYQEVELASNLPWPLVLLGATLVVGGLIIGVAWKTGGKSATPLGIGAAHILLYVAILAFVLPTFEPTKTYRPQSEWISNAIDGEPRFGMVDEWGVPRRGGFAYYTRTDVDLLDGPPEAVAYLQQYPKTIVLVRSHQFDSDFGPTMEAEALRFIGEVRVGKHLYYVVEPGWLETGRPAP